MIYEDEEEGAISEGAIHGKQMLHQVYTSARGGTITREELTIGSLIQALQNENEREAILILKSLRLSDVIAYRVSIPSNDPNQSSMNIL